VLAGAFVAPGLVAVEALAGEEFARHVEGLLDRVGDALGGRGVLEVAGVADQRPAGAGALAEEAAQHRLGGDADAADLPALLEPGGVEPVLVLLQGLEEGALTLGLVAAGQPRVEAEDQHREVVLGRGPDQRALLDHVDFELVGLRQAAPVAEHEGHLARQRPLLPEPEQAGDGGDAAVGAEHPAGRDLLAALEDDAAGRVLVGAAAEQAADLLAEAGLGAGVDRDLEQRRVEDRPGDRGHPVEAADRGERSHRFVAEGADRVLDQVDPVLPFDPLQRPELGQPRQRVREQGVGREGVGGRRLAVEEQDPPALLRQPRRHRGAGDAGADHDRVVAAAPAAHDRFLATVRRYSISKRAPAPSPRFHSAKNSLRAWSSSSVRPSFSALARAAIVGP